MGTSGLIGFKYNGVVKTQYNQYDMYPEGKGVDLLHTLNAAYSPFDISNPLSKKNLVKMFNGLIVVQEEKEPSSYYKLKYHLVRDTQVNCGRGWYSLLRGMQGDISFYLNGKVKHITGDADFFGDCSCEYSYFINIDNLTLECFVGTEVLADFPLDDLPSKEEFLQLTNK